MIPVSTGFRKATETAAAETHLEVLLVPLLLDVLMSKWDGVNQSITQLAGVLGCRATSWSLQFEKIDRKIYLQTFRETKLVRMMVSPITFKMDSFVLIFLNHTEYPSTHRLTQG